MGELVATVKALAENSNRQFIELSRELEKLSNQFTEYKNDQGKQALRDYEYLDGKISKVDSRVIAIESAHATADASPIRKFVGKMGDTLATLLTGGIVAVGIWMLVEYAKAN